mmetsp:Transcript_25454/g.64613  ORF Transcript_25454/g.64613 Transcript_25454/m.64613 type:complete len:207 (+) Transcript_25454:292-912(+)
MTASTQSMTPDDTHRSTISGCLSVMLARTPRMGSITSSSPSCSAAQRSSSSAPSCSLSRRLVPSECVSCLSAPSAHLTASLLRPSMVARHLRMATTPPASLKSLQISSLAASCLTAARMAARASTWLGSGTPPAPSLALSSVSSTDSAWCWRASTRAFMKALEEGGRSSSAVVSERSTPHAPTTSGSGTPLVLAVCCCSRRSRRSP